MSAAPQLQVEALDVYYGDGERETAMDALCSAPSRAWCPRARGG